MSSRFVCLLLCGLLTVPALLAQEAPAPSATGVPPDANDPSTLAMATAIGLMNKNDVDGALAELTQAIKLNPKNSAALVLRASVECQKKMWTQAQDDFNAAQALDPHNVVLKFNVVEVKFMQKEYDAARAGYVALEGDPDMGDLAEYKVFLCDLAGGHDALAKKEFDHFNDVGSRPSYYFGNAAWDIAHKNYDDAREWLTSAGRIYAPRKNAYYAESLIYLGYLPLPQDATAKTP